MDRLFGQQARKPKPIIKTFDRGQTSSALSGKNERKKIEMRSDSGVHVRKLGIESLANVGEKEVIFTQCSEDMKDTFIKISDLPHDILFQIFGYLDLGAATCFALSHPHIYASFRTIHSTSIPLSTPCSSPPGIFYGYLVDVLERWMGPKYRKKHWGMDVRMPDPKWAPPGFLRKETYGDKAPKYGDKEWEMEWALFERYSDYYKYRRSPVSSSESPSSSSTSSTMEPEHILHNPFNLGSSWYAIAKMAVIADAANRKDWNIWMVFWSASHIFEFISYKEKLKVLQKLELEKAEEELEGKEEVVLVETLKAERLRAWWRMNLRLVSWWVGDLPEMRPWLEVRGKNKVETEVEGFRKVSAYCSTSDIWSQGYMI